MGKEHEEKYVRSKLGGLKEKRKYWNMKEEAIVRLARSHRTVARQAT